MSLPVPHDVGTCPNRLNDDLLAQYWRDGYLAFDDALTSAEVHDACAALKCIVRRACTEPSAFDYCPPETNGVGNQTGAVFQVRDSRCFFQLEAGQTPQAEPEALDLQVRKFMWFEEESALLASFCTNHPRTFGIVEQILGGAVALYQSMALVKPARYGREKPWHQDNAYFAVENMDHVIGTWIALDDVDVDNGCMHVLPGGHRAGPLRHHHTFDCEIMPGRIEPLRAVPVPLRAGGILIFHANLPHQTPSNRSNRRRRALQYHYRRTDNAVISNDAFDRIFAEADGTPASCEAARRNGF
jgi:hypothetical protein